ncbi:MAG: hypothetical protein GC199_05475 [Alphaproteobacteria bacterium]|nr:hypothetical protein [Alphaproteobacteria bacterium]
MTKSSGAVLAIALSALFAGTAYAGENAVQGAFGNSLKVATPSGESVYFFDPNGTFTRKGADGEAEGLWSIKGDKVCVQPAGGSEECEIAANYMDVGQSWQQSYKGAQATVTVGAGR